MRGFNIDKSLIYFVGSNIIKFISQALIVLLVSKFVIAEDYGTFNYYSLILGYFSILNLGLISGGSIVTIKAKLKNKTNLFNKIVETMNSYFILLGLATAIFLLIFNCILTFESIYTKIGVNFIIITAFLLQIEYLYSLFLRALDKFKTISLINIIVSIIHFISLFIIIAYKNFGLYLRIFVVQIVVVIIYIFYSNLQFNFKFNKRIFNLIVKIGLPLYIVNYIYTFSYTFDKLLLGINFSKTELGIYVFGNTPFVIFSLIAFSLNSYFYPQIIEQVGSNSKNVFRYFIKKCFILILIVIPIILIYIILAKLFFIDFFPNYSGSLIITYYSIFSGALFIIYSFAYNILTILKNNKFLYFYIMIHLFLFVIVPNTLVEYFNFIKFSISIENISMMFLCINFLFTIIVFYYIYMLDKNNKLKN